jgi:anaerobic selenocysteine-containing dehydrogenase
MEGRPTVKIHPDDLAALGIEDGHAVRLGNRLGAVKLHTEAFEGIQRGVVVVESVWPNAAFEEGIGLNVLISADPGLPAGGAVFHDTAIWIKPA